MNARDGWDTLLDCESMGVRIRDTEGEFAGAAFRDPATGLLFAYDYVNRIDIRVFGHDMKPRLFAEMKRLGVEVRDRIMLTALLTRGEGEGKRVVGAMGVHTRTGEFVVVRAKAVILATGMPGRLWVHTTEYRSTFRDPNLACDGMAAAWNAGAEFVRLEDSSPDGASLAYLAYGVGNAHNTWHGCPIVDANGREVPWVDRDGKELRTVEERFRPSPGQRFMVAPGLRVPENRENHVPQLAPDLPDRIRKGEFVLPLYADLTRLPPLERRAIFGLMVGNEGKTRIAVYDTLTRAGFDPDRDMLQVPVMSPDAYGHANFWAGVPVPQWRQWGGGGLLVDWDLATSLPGLYAAGGAVYGAGAHSSAAASGRWAGRRAAAWAARAQEPTMDRGQVDREKDRVYRPLSEPEGMPGLGWKELNAGICRVMQDNCGAVQERADPRGGDPSSSRARAVRGAGGARGKSARARADARMPVASHGGRGGHAGVAGPAGEQQSSSVSGESISRPSIPPNGGSFSRYGRQGTGSPSVSSPWTGTCFRRMPAPARRTTVLRAGEAKGMNSVPRMIPNPPTPNRAVAFDPALCNGCNRCVQICRSDLLMPNPRKGSPPLVLYPDECWHCGVCVIECPRQGAITLLHPLNQSVSVAWKRASTGAEYRLGMKNPPPATGKPPSG